MARCAVHKQHVESEILSYQVHWVQYNVIQLYVFMTLPVYAFMLLSVVLLHFRYDIFNTALQIKRGRMDKSISYFTQHTGGLDGGMKDDAVSMILFFSLPATDNNSLRIQLNLYVMPTKNKLLSVKLVLMSTWNDEIVTSTIKGKVHKFVSSYLYVKAHTVLV